MASRSSVRVRACWRIVRHWPSAPRTELRDAIFHTPDRKSTRLNSSHVSISYGVFCLKKKNSKVHVGDQDVGAEHQGEPDRDQQDLRAEIADREDKVQAGGILGALDVEQGERGDQGDT